MNEAVWPHWQQHDAQLRAVEAALAAGQDTIELHVRRANLLDETGRSEAAKQAYLAILHATLTHLATLNRLGLLLNRTGYRRAARTLFAQAVACHPDDAEGHVNLANLLCEDGKPEAALPHFQAALELGSRSAEAHQGLGNAFERLGDTKRAHFHWRCGFGERPIVELVYRGRGAPIRVLLLVAAGNGNVRFNLLLDDRVFSVTLVAPAFTSGPLPPHDLVINAIGDADLCRPALEAAATMVGRLTAPVINHPAAILATGRINNAQRLAGIPGVVAPPMAVLPRAAMFAPQAAERLARAGFGFPVLLRSPGLHGGQEFLRVDAPAQLAAAAATLPGEVVMAIAFHDVRGQDGLYRKCRVMIVDGEIYPLHLAISRDWKVHYFTAAMADDAAHRNEEAQFLADMPGFLGSRAMGALRSISALLAIDYGGIDFALDRKGNVVLFEANATMVVLAPPAGDMWNYRRHAAAHILRAVQDMLIGRAGRMPAACNDQATP
jgi:hypothetical protein